MTETDELDRRDDPLPNTRIDALFDAWRRGEKGAFDGVFSVLYEQLHQLARRQAARGGADETLRTTALLHEAYMRLADSSGAGIQSREHFFSLAARAMRFVLVDHARRHQSDKRGGGAPKMALDDAGQIAVGDAQADEILMADQALERLAQLDARQAKVFELRTFGGLGVDEVGELLDIAPATVKRDWEKAKLFVARELGLQSPT